MLAGYLQDCRIIDHVPSTLSPPTSTSDGSYTATVTDRITRRPQSEHATSRIISAADTSTDASEKMSSFPLTCPQLDRGQHGAEPISAIDPYLNAVVMPTPPGKGGDPPREGEGQTQGPMRVPITSSTLPSTPSQLRHLQLGFTEIPGWSAPPKVLVVDDDATCRQLSSKFLRIFGCFIDIAVDGLGAVSKMNTEKYDIVFMAS